MKLSRYWMTGCMALVLLVAGRGASAAAREEGEQDERRGVVTASSQRPLDETLQRLRAAARRHGFDIMVNLAGGSGPWAERVLVLGHRDGRTPVVQTTSTTGREGGWELPLRLWLRSGPDGATQIIYGDPRELKASGDLPPEMLQDVAALPAIVSAALTAGPPAGSDVDRRA
ncbi:MAG TPA: hypothetical protein VFW84_04595 [Aquabacterium sp.]|uniref:hypothetical protein n=1 Tax=Aquabacterium sp. TaxID=1872578 RepID=UPI002D9B88DF|nr:hypothetical protein [Aquabacterium sp.]HET6787020.1 hypothetical protein [Aquabacterium sp.]HEX5371991.1 hypothetical protein [Aquabacterium sp.]